MRHAERDWYYSYRTLFDLANERQIKLVADKTLEQYSKLTKNWTVAMNSEWTCRIYLATKMILNATVLFNSLAFASKLGLRAANPYFRYYATLSLLRAVVYTIPNQEWADGELMRISHSKAINVALDWIAKFDSSKAEEFKKICLELKAHRELISYSVPASGE